MYELVTMDPTSSSPVLKRKIKFTITNTFPFTLAKEDLTVNAISQDDATYIRYMNVIAVDDAEKSFTVMFGGAYSGLFDLEVYHKTFGKIKSSAFTLDVSSEVTAVSINEISPYGGTLITITGTNFGDEFTDNPVQISYNGGVGSTDCFLQSTSATEIVCRVDDSIDKSENTDPATLVVFLKTSEEAVCDS